MKYKIDKKKVLSFSPCILSIALCVSIFAYADSAYKITDDTTDIVNDATPTTTSPEAMEEQSFINSGISAKSPNMELKAEIERKNNSKFDSVIFTDLSGQDQIVDLENIVYTSINNISWIDNTRFAIDGHINPSLNVYVVVDARNKKLIGAYYGLGFTWNKSKDKLYYIETSPHFSAVRESDKIVDSNHNIYYEAASATTMADRLSVSEDERTFAFFVNDEATEKTKLCIAKLNGDNKLEKQSELDASIGDIKINNNNVYVAEPNGVTMNYQLN